MSTQEDRDNLADKCRQYRACKQMKKRRFRNERLGAIVERLPRNSPEFWKIIDKICPQSVPANGPTGQEFVEYFQKLSLPQSRDYFDYSLENYAKCFLQRMSENYKYNSHCHLENTIINDHFTIPEIENAIDYLKKITKPPVLTISPQNLLNAVRVCSANP